MEKVLGGHLLPRQPLGEYNALLSRYQQTVTGQRMKKVFGCLKRVPAERGL